METKVVHKVWPIKEDMKIGPTLRTCRLRAGLSQVDLAARAGISRVYLGELERDIKSPTLDVFCNLAEALKIAPSKLLGRIERNK